MQGKNSPLTPADVRRRVAAIRDDMAGDDEWQHGAEDALHCDVLEAIRDNSEDEDARELAAAALETRDLKFARWCA